eukprot:TRINITY_DN17926_c0_g3_i1.p1 TRINITY_DN17926_c0_g3~~TRINITY_DN17926_c0_g3_i1.p1  ORF type:complete len:642 (+),score=165.82 TRINITY_DN17926_c0_g3_i1:52-1926(+)
MEKRIDAFDGKEYTYQEMLKFYKDSWKKSAVKAYWDTCAVVTPKAKAKAKVKAKSTVKDSKKLARTKDEAYDAWDLLKAGNDIFAHAMPEGHTGQYEVLSVQEKSKGKVPRVEISIALEDHVVTVSPMALLPKFTRDDMQDCQPYVKVEAREQYDRRKKHEKEASLKKRLDKALSQSSDGDDSAELLLQMSDDNYTSAFRRASKLGNLAAMKSLFHKAKDDSARKSMLQVNVTMDSLTPLMQAAEKGDADTVAAMLSMAEELGNKGFVMDYLAMERKRIVDMDKGIEKPIEGKHALALCKDEACTQLLLRSAERAGGEDFKSDLLQGRPKRVTDKMREKKDAMAARMDKYHKGVAVTADTPAEEAAEALIAAIDSPLVKSAADAARFALLRKNYGAATLIAKNTGSDIFAPAALGSRDETSTLLYQAVQFGSPEMAAEATKTVLSAASEIGGDSLVKEILTQACTAKEERLKLPGISHAKVPGTRKAILEVAAKLGIQKEMEAAPVLYPRSLGSDAVKPMLPQCLKVSGAGNSAANGEYNLLVSKDGELKWSGKGAGSHPLWANTTSGWLLSYNDFHGNFAIYEEGNASTYISQDGSDPLKPVDTTWKLSGRKGVPPVPTVQKQ